MKCRLATSRAQSGTKNNRARLVSLAGNRVTSLWREASCCFHELVIQRIRRLTKINYFLCFVSSYGDLTHLSQPFETELLVNYQSINLTRSFLKTNYCRIYSNNVKAYFPSGEQTTLALNLNRHVIVLYLVFTSFISASFTGHPSS